jgi:type IV secretory pathway VirB4 component
MRNTAVIMSEGINCLLNHLGSVETEIFISNLLKEPFDYTEWQREHFTSISLEAFNRQAAQYDREHPFS